MAGLEIPYQQLSTDALRGLIEEFVSRDGTDYGEREVPLDEKVAAVERQLRAGEAVILYDPDTYTCTIISRREHGSQQ